jgi:hypothetical protein
VSADKLGDALQTLRTVAKAGSRPEIALAVDAVAEEVELLRKRTADREHLRLYVLVRDVLQVSPVDFYAGMDEVRRLHPELWPARAYHNTERQEEGIRG